ncbi:Hypothetical predicted protein [Octopus vulgaris]|uniref:Uncharacterized protein n=1 Tax=Octopus vulgaris TaxID=6645 RepID=A0AA36B5F7_OCTVU|nr:Hypothetical predicted protein [Octopus vulgaris]
MVEINGDATQRVSKERHDDMKVNIHSRQKHCFQKLNTILLLAVYFLSKYVDNATNHINRMLQNKDRVPYYNHRLNGERRFGGDFHVMSNDCARTEDILYTVTVIILYDNVVHSLNCTRNIAKQSFDYSTQHDTTVYNLALQIQIAVSYLADKVTIVKRLTARFLIALDKISRKSVICNEIGKESSLPIREYLTVNFTNCKTRPIELVGVSVL